MSTLRFLSLIWAACLIHHASASLFTVGQPYFTAMLGGTNTVQRLQSHVTTGFNQPANFDGDVLASPMCTLTHGEFSATSFMFEESALSVTPDASNGVNYIKVVMGSVSTQITLPSFTVRCVFPQPFNGDVSVEMTKRGNANFTWSGTLEWHLPLSADGKTVTVAAAVLQTSVPLQLSYAYADGNQFLLDPYTEEWFTSRTATLSSQFEEFLGELAQHYFNPLSQTAFTVLDSYAGNKTCKRLTVDGVLNITTGKTCNSTDSTTMPGLSPSTVQVLDRAQSFQRKKKHELSEAAAAAAAEGIISDGIISCDTGNNLFVFPTNYVVEYTTNYCTQADSTVSAEQVLITSVNIIWG